MFFWRKKKKVGTALAFRGEGSYTITVDFYAIDVDVRIISPHHHPNCVPEPVSEFAEAEIIRSGFFNSQIKISWKLSHQALIQYTIVG